MNNIISRKHLKYFVIFSCILFYSISNIFSAEFNNPYETYSEYEKEIQTDTGIREINNYIEDVSHFTQNKCQNCENVIIVGNDFVIPQYRNSVLYEGFFKPKKETILTDILFTKTKSTLSWNKLPEYLYNDLAGSGVHSGSKQVTIILPQNPSYLMHSQAVHLKQILEELDEAKKVDVTVAIRSAGMLSCDYKSNELIQYSTQGTVILIGTPKTNPLLNCFIGTLGNKLNQINENEFYLERNIWQDTQAAIIIPTQTGQGVKAFNEFLKSRTFEAFSYNKASVWMSPVLDTVDVAFSLSDILIVSAGSKLAAKSTAKTGGKTFGKKSTSMAYKRT